MKKLTAKEVLDELFKDVAFDKNFYKKINYLNIQFLLKGENKTFFGSQLIGCYIVKYTTSDKSDFFEFLFDMDYEYVDDHIKKIETIYKEFKIARDSVNLVSFYIAHRFLSNKLLSKKDSFEYAKEILNYFNYRTLVTLTSNYFIYPISEEEALSIFERLSNKYIIKKVKNWKEYCDYRSEEYLKSKFYDLLLKMNDDDALPNAINDLYSRTKDTIKNIYSEFMDMYEKDEALVKRKNVINDIEGQEVISDIFNHNENAINNILSSLNDRNTFIKNDLVDVTCEIIKNLSFKHLYECLNIVFNYTHKNHKNYEEVTLLIKRIIVYVFSYLQRNEVFLTNKNNILKILDLVIGNLLYARSTDKEIDNIKNDIINIIKLSYKEENKKISNKSLNNLKNGFFIYIVLKSLV